MVGWKTTFLLKWVPFRRHVGFQGTLLTWRSSQDVQVSQSTSSEFDIFVTQCYEWLGLGMCENHWKPLVVTCPNHTIYKEFFIFILIADMISLPKDIDSFCISRDFEDIYIYISIECPTKWCMKFPEMFYTKWRQDILHLFTSKLLASHGQDMLRQRAARGCAEWKSRGRGTSARWRRLFVCLFVWLVCLFVSFFLSFCLSFFLSFLAILGKSSVVYNRGVLLFWNSLTNCCLFFELFSVSPTCERNGYFKYRLCRSSELTVVTLCFWYNNFVP